MARNLQISNYIYTHPMPIYTMATYFPIDPFRKHLDIELNT